MKIFKNILRRLVHIKPILNNNSISKVFNFIPLLGVFYKNFIFTPLLYIETRYNVYFDILTKTLTNYTVYLNLIDYNKYFNVFFNLIEGKILSGYSVYFTLVSVDAAQYNVFIDLIEDCENTNIITLKC